MPQAALARQGSAELQPLRQSSRRLTRARVFPKTSSCRHARQAKGEGEEGTGGSGRRMWADGTGHCGLPLAQEDSPSSRHSPPVIQRCQRHKELKRDRECSGRSRGPSVPWAVKGPKPTPAWLLGAGQPEPSPTVLRLSPTVCPALPAGTLKDPSPSCSSWGSWVAASEAEGHL